MTDNDSSKFKMRIDDESPDLQFREEIDELRVEKLSKRINRIAILIPCLVGIIILVAYFDIKKSLIKMNSSGTMEVQTLSKELESRFSSLSVKQASLEEALTKKIESLEKTTASLKATLKEATTAIKYIRSARKTDNKKLESAIAAINKTLSPIPKDLENIASNIRKIKGITDKPVCVGFGISNEKQARLISAIADGVIVGSAIIDVIARNIRKKTLAEEVGKFASRLAGAIHNE